MSEIETLPTYRADIFIAGDLKDAERCCREFCEEGLCVTVTPTEFIFTRGQEAGVRIGLVNYPRFPEEPGAIKNTALRLAAKLKDALFQRTALVVTDDETIWLPDTSPKGGE